MAELSKEDIAQRVKLFVKCVRDKTNGHRNKSNDQNHPNALTFLEQIGVTKEIMTKHYGRTWITNIGDTLFQSYFR